MLKRTVCSALPAAISTLTPPRQLLDAKQHGKEGEQSDEY